MRLTNSDLPATVRALIKNRGLQVKFIPGACPSTNGKNIILPPIPVNAEPDDVTNIVGSADHESAHCLYTDFTVKRKRGLASIVLNVVEDARIERKLAREYPGCKQNLARSAEIFISSEDGQQKMRTIHKRASSSLLLFIDAYCRVKDGQNIEEALTASTVALIEFGYHELIDKIRTILDKSVDSMESTQDALKVTEKIMLAIKAAQKKRDKQKEEQQKPDEDQDVRHDDLQEPDENTPPPPKQEDNDEPNKGDSDPQQSPDEGSDPDDGEDPQDGTDPDKGEDPEDGTDPDKGEDPDEGTDPDKGEDPDEGSDPDDGTDPDKGEDPDEGDDPDDGTDPDKGEDPDEGDDPDKGDDPDEGDDPDKGEDPDEGEDPDKGEDPDEGDDPDKGEDPDEGDDPDKGEDPDEGDDPDKGEDPDEGDDPDKGEDPDEGDDPDEGEKPDDGEDKHQGDRSQYNEDAEIDLSYNQDDSLSGMVSEAVKNLSDASDLVDGDQVVNSTWDIDESHMRSEDSDMANLCREATKPIISSLVAKMQAGYESSKHTRWLPADEGNINPRRLAMAGAGIDNAPFRIKHRSTKINTAVWIGIDLSGSMYTDCHKTSWYQANYALTAAMAVAEANQRLNVSTEVAAFYKVVHTNDADRILDADTSIPVIKSFNEPMTKLYQNAPKVSHINTQRVTPTPEAILAGARALNGRPEGKKILILLTDGVPMSPMVGDGRLKTQADYDRIGLNSTIRSKAAAEYLDKLGIILAVVGIRMTQPIYWAPFKNVTNLTQLPAALLDIVSHGGKL